MEDMSQYPLELTGPDVPMVRFHERDQKLWCPDRSG